ncbi:MAG: transcriptional regulator MntR [Rickettsiales bacterium]|nr:transcriptional regulator MntR [Rickettsiales bacterium]|tara:strand:+ start:1128 stop:1571 length:444 start_codon:yes stop_codon:yes gene_type:complete
MAIFIYGNLYYFMLFISMSFSKVRNAHKTENTEDYLELISEMHNLNGEARIVDIAKRLGIAQATANKTIKRLQNQGFVNKEPYRSLFLTLKGQKIASFSKKRHITVYNFLINLGLDPKTAEADSEGIEHHVSEKTLKKMERFNKKNK